MPKMKTRKSAAKRLKQTGTGKFMYNKAGRRHILTKKSSKRKRSLSLRGIVKKSEMARIRIALPYAIK